MSSKPAPLIYGKTVGIFLLTTAQITIGIIHSIFGLSALLIQVNDYNTYTLIFGALTLAFSQGLWTGKNVGKIGTIIVSSFVAVADILTILDLPSVPGIPKVAAYPETIYSLLIIAYLLQKGAQQKDRKPK